MYTIGKLSNNTGVTVRTLDYYDEIGLVKPSSKTSGGHRLYNEDNVMQLEQVLALKYMGFSLEEIKEILKDSPSTWRQSIQQQLEFVKQEQERLQTLERALLGVSQSIEVEGVVNWSIIFATIQLFQKGPKDILQQYKAHLNDEEMEKIMNMDAQLSEEDLKEWMGVIVDIKNNLDIDPASEKAKELVERWANKADSMFGNDEELLGSMWEALQNLQDGIAFYPMDKEVIDFIKQTITINYRKQEGEKMS